MNDTYENIKKMKESFSKIPHGYGTAFNQGGPIHAISLTKNEEKIVNLDKQVMDYKDKFKDRLNKVWEDTIKETQSYRFDQTISKVGSLDSSKTRSFQIGKKIVVDEEMQFK